MILRDYRDNSVIPHAWITGYCHIHPIYGEARQHGGAGRGDKQLYRLKMMLDRRHEDGTIKKHHAYITE